MRLVFDARYIRPDAPDGIGRFTQLLAQAVVEATPGPDWEVVFLISDVRQRAALPEGAVTELFWSQTSWREPGAAWRLNRMHPDVVFTPMQTLGTLGRRYAAIVTLHDLIYYRHRRPPRDLPLAVRVGWRLFYLSFVPQRMVLNGADAVCTVSQTSAEEIARVRLTKRPIVVVPNAPIPRVAATPVRPGPDDVVNLVYMGSFMGYKNVETLVRAAGELGDGYRLHLLSRIDARTEAALRAIDARVQLVFHHGVSDDEYAAILADRAILVTASLDEGYGLPVAEGISAGAPAVVSELPIFHEVAGDGALYFEAMDARAAAAQIRRLRDPELWDAVVAAGGAHVATFSWRHSAAELWAAVQRLAS